jgi:hypothetical protein
LIAGDRRLDGEVDQQPNGIFRILLRRPFEPEVDGPHEVALRQRSFSHMNLQQQGIRDKGIANPACHYDDGLCLLCLAN